MNKKILSLKIIKTETDFEYNLNIEYMIIDYKTNRILKEGTLDIENNEFTIKINDNQKIALEILLTARDMAHMDDIEIFEYIINDHTEKILIK